ncbi:63 kDa protein [Striga asiatica]|uniref:63 kDa protein n=1 Tax=Striga asiatica TaxID=4170 RepID=A0A5A7PCP7_STRAF|nr:63 kDa protein [Striga asiatica]
MYSSTRFMNSGRNTDLAASSTRCFIVSYAVSLGTSSFSNNRIRPPPNSLRQLSAFFVPDIARRRPNEPRDRVLLHVLTHVDPHESLLRVEHVRGKGLGQLGFPNPSGPHEHETSNRAVGVREACPGPVYGLGYGANRRFLADYAFVELFLEMQKFLPFRLEKFRDGNSGPLAHDFGDVVTGDFLAEHGFSGLQVLVEFSLGGLELPLKGV